MRLPAPRIRETTVEERDHHGAALSRPPRLLRDRVKRWVARLAERRVASAPSDRRSGARPGARSRRAP
jgi:hypothetical protein